MSVPDPFDLSPGAIESRSFAIIAGEMDASGLPEEVLPIVTRVVHATADFDFVRTLRFSPGAVAAGLEALRRGCAIVTDTRMAMAGINARAAAGLGCSLACHIRDEDVAAEAARTGRTRSRVAVDKAAGLYPGGTIYVVGNAPTALARIAALAEEGRIRPSLVVGVPVGFVNVVESKERVLASGTPHIVSAGRKGGSTVAAAICNAMLYMAENATACEAGRRR